ncbi:riboflavin synthase [Formicincola oecophyllae]|uniref:Riboflavin synthase n=1 Tax=Formicincola oecophyllae TaxID=2558361 RepID=A0A4Y6UAY4_9PROT|nr:riboflavin synthase [Formicincola oecophyllae]QDH13551.1 riboflavin synthase [Formicincola oecophyllae]
MFSGIIEQVGTVLDARLSPHGMGLVLQASFQKNTVKAGDSIAVNGVCLTVENQPANSDDPVRFHVSGETLQRTALGRLQKGGKVNLERAVALQTRLSGHMVQGHVDGCGRLEAVRKEGDSWRLQVAVPWGLRRYVVEKGSVALDGVSLTVNTLSDTPDATEQGGEAMFTIGLAIIPHTWAHTALGTMKVGDKINVEVDVLAKYAENMMRFGQGGAAPSHPASMVSSEGGQS